jgi:succinyl-CoA synthetase beta subunit
LKIHECEAKQILMRYGVICPKGLVASTPEEVEKAAKTLGGQVVVKAQIHAGGRGKAGGVKRVDGPAQARAVGEALLGKPLVTCQTGPRGRVVRKVLVEETLEVDRELYLAMLVDRETSAVVVIGSSEGGTEIEQVAAKTPEKIRWVKVHPIVGLMPNQARGLAFDLGLSKEQGDVAVKFLLGMYRAFIELDASLMEINPLVVTDHGDLIALDAKINFDDNAIFRHPDVGALRDVEQEDPAEVEAAKHEFSYIRLDGDIGCMVNGAGLAMATMDIIKLFGGEPANFLDVGGRTDSDRVKKAFKVLLSDPNVRAVLVNIFGGIVKCDVIAQGVVDAVSEDGTRVPLVVRLQGTNVARGQAILRNSGLNIIAAETMKEAAEAAVLAARRKP